MQNIDILFPLFALAGWTFLILLLIPFVRVRSVRRREIGPNDFKYGESPAVPPSVSIPFMAGAHVASKGGAFQ